METWWRVGALAVGLVALVLVHALVRGAPPWLALVLDLGAFAVAARAVNAVRPSQRRRARRRSRER